MRLSLRTKQTLRRGVRIIAALLVAIAAPALASAASVAAGASHSGVVKTTDNSAWTWGYGANGRLGIGSTTQQVLPVQVGSPIGFGAVAGGGSHTLFLRSDGTVWASGYNAQGQLGDNSVTQRLWPVQVRVSPTGYLTEVIAIAAGLNFSLALKSDGTLWAWGQNNNGQLGDNTAPIQKKMAVQVLRNNGGNPPTALTGITAIATGDNHGLAVKSDGSVWAWGNGTNGRLGNGLTTQQNTAVQTSFQAGTVITSVAAGSMHSLARKSDGTLWAWGSNGSGRLGDGTQVQRLTPVPVHLLTAVTTMSAGKFHSVAVESDGTVHTWGLNNHGQLGNGGATANELEPISVPGITNAISVTAAADHTLAVSLDGVVWAFGRNDKGQIGDGTAGAAEKRLSPVAISDPGFNWKVATPGFDVASGTYSTTKTVNISCATPGATVRYTLNGDDPTPSSAQYFPGQPVNIQVSSTLKAKAWYGTMPESNVGIRIYELKASTPSLTPGGGPYGAPQNVAMSTTTPGATIYYTSDGSEPSSSSTPYQPGTPVYVPTTTTLKAKAIKAGWTDSTTRTATYTMKFGTLAAPTFDPPAGTYESSVTVTMTAMPGATITYTDNGSNPLPSSPVYTPPGIMLEGTKTLKAKAFHPDYTASPITTGVYTVQVAAPVVSLPSGTYPAGTSVTITGPTAGSTIYYTLNGTDPTTSDPTIASGGTLVAGNYTLKAMATKTGCVQSATASATYEVTGQLTAGSIAAGQFHSSAARWDGLAFGWGSNGNGQLGDGTLTLRATPVLVPSLTGVTGVAAGGWHTLFLRSDATLWTTGYNAQGQLGDNTNTQRTRPVQVKTSGTSFLTDVTAIAAGHRFSLALKSDGTVWSWGDNAYGQLGDNTTTPRKVAVQVLTDGGGSPTPLTGITAIAAGSYHAFAVNADGTVWAWGQGSSGQLGNGLTAQQNMAVKASFAVGTVITSVAGGETHGLAVEADGTAWSWGSNSFGQLGDGTTNPRATPGEVPDLTGIEAMSAGYLHSLALGVDGTAWAWGNGGNGRLGDGSGATKLSPVQVAMAYVARFAAGHQHNLAMTTDGSLWAWGGNFYKQVGDGTAIDRWSPVQISGPYSWKVGTRTFSLPAGTYAANQTVEILCATPDAAIHYTTDGTQPSRSSPAYTGAFDLTQTTVLIAEDSRPD